MLAHTVEDCLDGVHRRFGVLDDHCRQKAFLGLRQLLSQPIVDDLTENQVSTPLVRDRRARVDVGFDRIGFDQSLAEAMDRRAGDLVDRLGGCFQRGPLRRRQAIGKADCQFRRGFARE